MKTWHDYYRDKNKVEVLIKYTVRLPSRVDNFNIDDHPLHVKQEGGEIYVNYNKYISVALFEDIKEAFESFRKDKNIPQELLQRNPSQYIVGFIGETLPRINKEILDRKYNEGHIILRTVSQFDIDDVWIVDASGGFHKILWPNPLPKFPEVKKCSQNSDIIYIRDLIDAMSEYFYFNLDECIRKVITSLENYFIHYKLSVPSKKESFLARLVSCFNKEGRTRFAKQVRKYITEAYYPLKERDLKILRDNILFVYKIRNLIVHNKLRLSTDNLMFCKKAIGTLLYIYQSQFTYKDGNKKDYIFRAFDMQFKIIADMVLGLNLDKFEIAEKIQKKTKVIRNDDELNESMFASLKITEKDKRKTKCR